MELRVGKWELRQRPGLRSRGVWFRFRQLGAAAECPDDLLIIEVEADGFLYNMVRAIVGTLVEVGRGRRAGILARRSVGGRTAAPPAPPPRRKGSFWCGWNTDGPRSRRYTPARCASKGRSRAGQGGVSGSIRDGLPASPRLWFSPDLQLLKGNRLAGAYLRLRLLNPFEEIGA